MAKIERLKTSIGKPAPIGATCYENGVNFSIYSHTAKGIELLLFKKPDDTEPSHIIVFDPEVNKSTNYWHIFVEGIGSGQLYGYRVHGQFIPEKGYRFDPSKVLVDPYARAVIDDYYDRKLAKNYGKDNLAKCLKSIVVDTSDYDWEGDEPLNRPLNDSVIYEMHVRGFTQDPSSKIPVKKRGTYAGLIEKIPYLKDLGIRCVQLMPVFQFDRQSAPEGKVNYWGYQPINFFAPHRPYSSDRNPLGPVNEFRDMIKALHREGIEVILDVVFNHTAEENAYGPTQSLRGIDNLTYYLVNPDDQSVYVNDTGTGNTINANHSVVRRMILDSLRYWVQEMHVDGFRFDLASVLSRGEDGHPMKDPPILWSIDSDPLLVHTKIIAEAWDASGLYQVGSFVGDRWAVLNGHYRDVVRKFVRGDDGMVHDLTDVITGSARLFGDESRDPQRSINFITSHDGFTMNDLVSYNEKHNDENGEDNRDGNDHDFSYNYGTEGPANDPVTTMIRKQQIKNFFTILLLSQGPPMITMGDEIRKTLNGNNNAYTLDKKQNWFDWTAIERHDEMYGFVKELLFKRKNSFIFSDKSFWSTPGGTDVIWHGVKTDSPDFGHFSHAIALELYQEGREERFYAILNEYWEVLDFELPALMDHFCWGLLIDTSNDPPHDIIPLQNLVPLNKSTYRSRPHSVAVLRTIRK